MIQNVACVDGANPCPVTPWNSGMTLYGGSPTANQFIINLASNLYGTGTGKDCPALMAAIVQQVQNAGLVQITSNSGGTLAITSSTPVTSTQIVNCAGDVSFWFTL